MAALYRFVCQSPLSAGEVLERISAQVRATPSVAASFKESFSVSARDVPPFIGKVFDSGFSMRRNIYYRNAFLPHINGKVSDSDKGAVVRVEMNPNPVVTAFMLLWLGGVGLGGIVVALNGAWLMSLIPFGLFILGMLISYFGFFSEAKTARRIIWQKLGCATV